MLRIILVGWFLLLASCASKATSSPSPAEPPVRESLAGGMTNADIKPPVDSNGATVLSLELMGSISLGTCTELAIQSLDNTGAPQSVAQPVIVELGSSDAAGQFFSDEACVDLSPKVTIASGSTSATAFFRTQTTGASTMTAADESGGLASAEIPLSVERYFAFAMALGSTTQAQGSCGVIHLQAVDSQGQATTYLSDLGTLTIDFSTTSKTGLFYADSACSQPLPQDFQGGAGGVPSLVIQPGASEGDVYYKDLTLGAAAIGSSGNPYRPTAAILTIVPLKQGAAD